MDIAGKIEKILTLSDCERCYASRAQSMIIDVLHPATGKTVCYNKTIDEVRCEYPDAEEMFVDDFCDWKAEQQRTPIEWELSTEEQYDEMLNCLPPELWIGGAFLVGEPYDHDAGNGQPRFTAFKMRWGQAYQANRPLTKAEFRVEITAN